jgi:hypothetical protein
MQLFIFFLFFHYMFRLHAAASVEKNCIEGKQPPEDGCMKPKHVVEEEEENK